MQPPEDDEPMSPWLILGIFLVVLVVMCHLLYLLRRWIRGTTWPIRDLRLDNKVVVITGANSGIGKATALELARRGARVYLACRSKQRGEEARQEIIKETDNQEVFCKELDLGSKQSIRQFSRSFHAEESRLDVLINNAGLTGPKRFTIDGFESQIGVNHMGHFLLTNLMLDLLQNSAPSRVITLSSVAHRLGKLNRNDLNSDKTYYSFLAYAQSKLANILFSRELARRMSGTGVTSNVANPGPVHTTFPKDINFLIKLVWLPFSYFFFKSPHLGAQTTIRLALDPQLENTTGQYFSDCKVFKESRAAMNDDDARWLWEESLKWTTERV